jgi:hypothetical protein
MHFPEGDIIAHAGDLVLLKRGVYFMTGFITDGVDYQSLILCMDDTLLRSFISEDGAPAPATPAISRCSSPVKMICCRCVTAS